MVQNAAMVHEGTTSPLPGVPAFESPFMDLDGFAPRMKPEHVPVARELRENGYAVIDFPDKDFESRAAAIRSALNDSFDWERWRRIGFASNEGLRIQDAWKHNLDVKAIATNENLLDLLSDVFGRQAQPFQTLNFPVGTQQHYHSDASHFSSVPEKFMCGVWVALEDIEADAGPLLYFPGTHKWPVFNNEHLGVTALNFSNGKAHSRDNAYDVLWRSLVKANKIEEKTFLARKGQALIWVSNILHGGSRQTNPDRTRWSQVTHYYFEGCAYYTPFFSDPFHGNILFREPTDILTGKPMCNRVGGKIVDPSFLMEVTERARRVAGGHEDVHKSQLAEVQAELAYHKARVDKLRSSLSWRVTKPLRSDFLQRLSSWLSPRRS